MGELTFITGPTRSGKSRRAVEQAKPWGNDAVFVATYASDGHDVARASGVGGHPLQRLGQVQLGDLDSLYRPVAAAPGGLLAARHRAVADPA